MKLTKTDYLHYLKCPESLWLFKNKPEVYPNGKFSKFLEKLTKEGYEVEEYAKKLFFEGVEIEVNSSISQTQKKLNDNHTVYFQPSFLSPKGIFARIDILQKLNDGTFHIYEVKSSTSIKKENLIDACFQKYVCEQTGIIISKASIIYLNKDFISKGEINPNDLLIIEDVTELLAPIFDSVINDIKMASNFIRKKSINENECSCKYNTRANHCDSFKFFNKNIKEYSIYEISRLGKKKINELVANNKFKIIDIPENFKLSDKQKKQVLSLKNNQPVIDKSAINDELNGLNFPLHFIDYETFPSAVPKIDRLSPHKHHTFQVSIHTLSKNGDLTHFEYLASKMQVNDEMINRMKKFTNLEGTFISWHASFEIERNKEMIELFPKHTEYLNYINQNMYDLERIFTSHYIDYRFQGYSSIKKVLPVLCPNLSYINLKIQDGTMALDTWGRMVSDPNFKEDIEETKHNLIEYCKMDTLAMVEIYNELRKKLDSKI
ncbi:MAG: phosphomethylpyrimidine kinase [Flavobacteriales bacterium]|nr:phosphomethylpyrimidine kinase [Flavobacteriales bacterium]